MGKIILKMQNLTKYYGKIKGVENLSLKLEEGEIFGFIGPNGAGKFSKCYIRNGRKYRIPKIHINIYTCRYTKCNY